ncbi:MAG TPA: Enamidase, partial [Negativicutes bacterium]
MSVIAITNIGLLVSGNVNDPVLNSNTIIIKDGKIQAVGDKGLLAQYSDCKTIDAGGMTVMPGLIDSHVHPVIGDYTPR